MKIVVYDKLALGDGFISSITKSDISSRISMIAPHARVLEPSADRLADELIDTEIFLGYQKADVFLDAQQLRWIQSTSAGMEHLRNPELIARDLIITNASGVHAPAVVETAWALTLAVARNIPTFVRQQQEHLWKWGPLRDMDGAIAGVIGLGGIGQRYARIAKAFGMRVLAVDPHFQSNPQHVEELWKMDQLPRLLEQSDVVLISCPSTKETQHLLDREKLSLMKPTAILVNIARGGIADETALADALRAGRLAGAGLDVCETEPLPADSPLWDVPNLVLTPHCAGLSSHRTRRVTDLFCENLRRYTNGETLLNVIDPVKGYPIPTR